MSGVGLDLAIIRDAGDGENSRQPYRNGRTRLSRLFCSHRLAIANRVE